jgi:hypothetical protein
MDGQAFIGRPAADGDDAGAAGADVFRESIFSPGHIGMTVEDDADPHRDAALGARKRIRFGHGHSPFLDARDVARERFWIRVAALPAVQSMIGSTEQPFRSVTVLGKHARAEEGNTSLAGECRNARPVIPEKTSEFAPTPQENPRHPYKRLQSKASARLRPFGRRNLLLEVTEKQRDRDWFGFLIGTGPTVETVGELEWKSGDFLTFL